MSTTRILNKAAELVALGLPAIEAIEVACARISTTEAARERARKLFLTAAARVERGAA